VEAEPKASTQKFAFGHNPDTHRTSQIPMPCQGTANYLHKVHWNTNRKMSIKSTINFVPGKWA